MEEPRLKVKFTDSNFIAFVPHELKTWVNIFKRLVPASDLSSLVLHPAHFTFLHMPPNPCKHLGL